MQGGDANPHQEDLHEALHEEHPNTYQQALISMWVNEATKAEIMDGWIQEAYTLREPRRGDAQDRQHVEHQPQPVDTELAERGSVMRWIMLPEPARTLLRRTGNPLTQALNEICERGRPWALGGGTVLASAWRHRRSEDLDIFVPEENSIETLRERVNPKFHQAMKSCGSQDFFEGEKSIKVVMPEGRIEISRLDVKPPGEAERAMVEGFEMCVLSPAQILTGKIRGRSDKSPDRDIFDIAIASELEPEGIDGRNQLAEHGRAESAGGSADSEGKALQEHCAAHD